MKSEQSVDLVKEIECDSYSLSQLDWCSEQIVILEIAPVESHNWIGSIERKHQVVRRILEIYKDRGERDKKTPRSCNLLSRSDQLVELHKRRDKKVRLWQAHARRFMSDMCFYNSLKGEVEQELEQLQPSIYDKLCVGGAFQLQQEESEVPHACASSCRAAQRINRTDTSPQNMGKAHVQTNGRFDGKCQDNERISQRMSEHMPEHA